MMLTFFVQGIPKPAGSKRGIPIYRGHEGHKEFTGHVAVIDACKSSKDWKATVSWEAKREMLGRGLQPFTKGLSLTVTFVMPRPKGHFGTGKNAAVLKDSAPRHHVIKPDCTKLLRGLEDACTGIVWVDDAQIFSQVVGKVYTSKLWPSAGAHVTVEEIDNPPDPK